MMEVEPNNNHPIEIEEDDANQEERRHRRAQQIRATRLLVVSYAFDESTQIIYQFVLVVFLSLVLPDSFLLVSLCGLVNQTLAFFLGPGAGRYFDVGVANNRRLQSILRALVGRHACIGACCALAYASSRLDENIIGAAEDDELGDSTTTTSTSTALLLAIVSLNGFVQLFGDASAVSIERDWIVVMSGNDANRLGGINVKLKRVHLVSKMIGPIASGYYLNSFGGRLGSAFAVIGIVNLVAFMVKYKCLKGICSAVPSLVMRGGNGDVCNDDDDDDDDACDNEPLHDGDECSKSPEGQDPRHCTSCIGGYIIYFQQDIALAGLGYSLLYLNVLTGGDIMTSYLISRGLSLSWIGIIRACQSISGLLGTVVFDCSVGKHPLRLTAVSSIAFQAASLSVSFGGIFVDNDRMALSMLVGGMIVSRIGLWGVDLSVRQLTQQTVQANVRGVVGGSQNSLNALLYAFGFVNGAIWSDPSQFYILCMIGYSAVVLAFALMLKGVYFSDAFKHL